MMKLLMAMVLMPLMVLAKTEVVDGKEWSYTVIGGQATVTGVQPATGVVEIPAMLGGCPVKSIGLGAFSSCGGLESVTIPQGVTSIGWHAFSGCSGLMSVTIPSSVMDIGEHTFYNCSGLEVVTIPDGVTSIGEGVFYGCNGLTSVTIPSSVTRIDRSAFYDCSKLTRAILPDGLLTIGDEAFRGCSSLTAVQIPEGVTSVGFRAFYCSGVKSVTIPSSVTNIGNEAFYGCGELMSFAVDSRNDTYCSLDGILYAKQDLKLICCPRGQTGVLTIPEGVTSIGDYALYFCTGLTSVTIPSSVTNIGDYAFYNCAGLTSVTIPSGVMNIGNYAFYCCSRLASVAISEGVMSIGSYAFNSCGCLTSVAIPTSVKSIGVCAFWHCNVVVVFVSEDPQECVIQCFGSQMWYQRTDTPIQYEWSYSKVNNDEATITGIRPAYGDVEIPSQIGGLTVTRIGERAFESCRGLTSVKIPSSVMHIGDDAFGSCDGLTSMRIPDGVTSIGDYVFYGCVMLEDVWFADSVLTMGRSMFTKCARLSSVRLPAKIDVIPDGMFCDCWALSSVEIPAGVKAIGEMSFQHCDAIECLVIPASVENISPEAFRGSSFSVIVVEENKKFQVDNGVLYDKGCERLIFCPTCISGKFTCPASVRGIDAAAFCECTDMTSIDIGDGVMTIGGRAFEDCKNLQEVTLPKNITAVEDSVFRGCSALTSLVVPKGVVKIASYAFAGCTSLKYLSLPSTVEDITRMFAWGVSGADTILFKGLPPKGLDTITSQKINRILYNSQFTSEWLEAAEAAGLCNLEPACLVDVTFVGNGGVEHPETREVTIGQPLGELPTATRAGYEFLGWFTSAVGGMQVTAAMVVTEDVTYYAHWRAYTYTVRFEANGGSGTMADQVFTYDVAQNLRANAFVRGGYYFGGWSLSESGNVNFAAEASVSNLTAEADVRVVLYAAWVQNDVSQPPIVDPEEPVEPVGPEEPPEEPIDPPEEPVEPTTPTNAPPTVVAEAETHVDVAKGEVAPYEDAAVVYYGYLYDGETVVGSVQVKVAKMKNGEAKVTATVQKAGDSKKISFKGGVADGSGRVTGLTAAGHTLDISLGVDGMGGTMDGNPVDGARNLFSAKDADSKSIVAAIEKKWVGAVNVVGDDVVLSVTIAKKGKVKVSGTVKGTKVSATSQLLVGAETCCVPVVITKKANLAFNLWLMADGSVGVVGLDGAVAGKAGMLRSGATFRMDGAAGVRALPGLYGECLPNGVGVTQSGTKWIVAGGAKAGKLALVKGTSEIDLAKSKFTDNMSGLKLTYKAKDGSFKGSFKAYNLEKGKIKSYTVNVTGVMIGAKGYGTATIKKPACTFLVTIE